MTQINHNILKAYATFERDVRNTTDTLFSRTCTSCATPCCKVEMCLESMESPFLRCFHDIFPPPVAYDPKSGWITPAGCALSVGRPPVCHEFLCDHITGMLPEGEHRYITKVLSYLITHIGKRILGSRHIVEITDIKMLKKIDASRFNQRLMEAEQAFSEIKSFYKSGRLCSQSIEILSKICPPPATVKTMML